MSWAVVAKKDFQDSARAKSLWAMTVLFVLFAGGIAFMYGGTSVFPGREEVNTIGFIGVLLAPGALFIPIIALLAGYKAIVGERESGSIKLLLGLPHSRRDVIIGKLVGRSLAITVPILIGYAVAAIIGLVMFTQFSPVRYLLFALLTVYFAIAYISLAVGFSAGMASESRAAAAAISLWFVLQVGWQIGIMLLRWVVNGFSMPSGESPAWILLIENLSPNPAYALAGHAFIPGAYEPGYNVFYLQSWVGIVIIAFWMVVPITLGYLRFRRADL